MDMKNKLKKSLISFFSLWTIEMVLLFVIAFSGCSTTKKVEKTKINKSIAAAIDSKNDLSKAETLKVTDKTEKVTDKSLTQIENETNELETRITEYDTDKPIVPGTNKSPVKKETITTNNKLSKKDTKSLDNSTEKSTSDAVYTQQLEASMKVLQSQNAKLIAETNSKETKSVTWWKWFFSGSVITLIIGSIVLWKWGSILSFLRKLKVFKFV